MGCLALPVPAEPLPPEVPLFPEEPLPPGVPLFPEELLAVVMVNVLVTLPL